LELAGPKYRKGLFSSEKPALSESLGEPGGAGPGLRSGDEHEVELPFEEEEQGREGVGQQGGHEHAQGIFAQVEPEEQALERDNEQLDEPEVHAQDVEGVHGQRVRKQVGAQEDEQEPPLRAPVEEEHEQGQFQDQGLDKQQHGRLGLGSGVAQAGAP